MALLPFGSGPTFDEAVAASRAQASFVRVPTDARSTRGAGERVAQALGQRMVVVEGGHNASPDCGLGFLAGLVGLPDCQVVGEGLPEALTRAEELVAASGTDLVCAASTPRPLLGLDSVLAVAPDLEPIEEQDTAMTGLLTEAFAHRPARRRALLAGTDTHPARGYGSGAAGGVGAIIAAIIYFWADIVRIVTAWFRGLSNQQARQDPDYTLGWGIILGSIPVAAVGLLFKDFIEGPVRSLWVIAGALIIWSGAMWLADHQQNLTKGMKDVTVKDALIIGAFQALAPVFPGISRSGATISAGLFLKFDRVTATRLSFYMGIPSLVAAGLLEAATEASTISNTVGWTPTIVATVVSGVVAYATIAWLLRFVSSNKFTSFLVYRVLLGLIIIALVSAGTIAA